MYTSNVDAGEVLGEQLDALDQVEVLDLGELDAGEALMTRPPPAVGDLTPVWPLLDLVPRVAADSFMRPRGSERPRFHAGMDLPAPRGTVVLAPESGRIVKLQTFNGAHAHALLLETDTGLVLNLGEVEPGSWDEFGVGKGSPVFQGQPVARVGINPGGGQMLHFETYRAGTRKTSSWYQDEGPPPSLLDPTDYILRAALRPVTSEGVAPAPVNPKPPPPAPVPPAPVPGPPVHVPAPNSGGGGDMWILLLLGWWWLRRKKRGGSRAD